MTKEFIILHGWTQGVRNPIGLAHLFLAYFDLEKNAGDEKIQTLIDGQLEKIQNGNLMELPIHLRHAISWRCQTRAVTQFLEKRREKGLKDLVIKYENLCSDPTACIRKIAKFLGESDASFANTSFPKSLKPKTYKDYYENADTPELKRQKSEVTLICQEEAQKIGYELEKD